MKATRNAQGIKISGILNESLLDDVTSYARRSGCNYESQDYMTKAVITGTKEQLDLFQKFWNNEANPWDKKYDKNEKSNNQSNNTKTIKTMKNAATTQTAPVAPVVKAERVGGKFVKPSKATYIRAYIEAGFKAAEIVAALAKKKITVRYSQVHRYFANVEVATA